MPRELPIIFCADMVKAILEGRKTQTRRIEGLKILNEHPERWTFLGWTEGKAVFVNATGYPVHIKPRYRVGDELWVKEIWAIRTDTEPNTPKAKHYMRYKVDGEDLEMEWHNYERWRSPRFMPKWAARLWLRVTAVKDPHQVQNIREEDAEFEGCEYFGGYPIDELSPRTTVGFKSTIEVFAALWNCLHPKPGERWEDNPWHFTYETKRIER